MMHLVSIPVVALLAATVVSQATEMSPPPKLERVCGKLERIELIQTKNKKRTLEEKKRNLPRAPVALYYAMKGQPCCEGVTPLATARTDRWGDFEIKLKHAPGGIYWLQVEPEGRKYKMLVQYSPKRNSDQMCSQTHWEIDGNGNFSEAVTITID